MEGFRVAKAKHLQHPVVQHPVKQRSVTHRIIVRINVIRPLAALVFGKHHSTGHRVVAGLGVAAVGVFVVQTFHLPHGVGSMAVDGIGYGLHGLGLTPIAEYLSEVFSED